MPGLSIKKLYVLLDGEGKNSADGEFEKRLLEFYRHLDIFSDLYFLTEDIVQDSSKLFGTVKEVAVFLRRYPFYRINIHPVHPLPRQEVLKDIYGDFLSITSPLHREAYVHQGVSRIMILPILIAEEEDDLQHLRACVDFLRDRLMIPSIYIRGGVNPSSIKGILRSDKERVYLELMKGGKLDRVIYTLGNHTVFDDLITWVNEPVRGSFPGCRSVVVTETDGTIYDCFMAVSSNQPIVNPSSVYDLSEIMKVSRRTGNKERDCLNCALECLALMKNTLRVNDREREADRISFHLGLELVKAEDYKRALEQFDRILKTNRGVEDMGTILLSKALCHLRRNEIEEASTAIDEAEKHLPSPAMICYYRGLCEFGLRDYIEAIDRFHEALKLGSPELPIGDVYFYTGLSHINIEEYDDGLTVMNHAERFFANKSPVYYYKGICYLGMQSLDVALENFKEALASRPQEEDLSSILLHLGLCYKEMERYEEAILELEGARKAEEGRKDIHNLMGYCYFKLKKYDAALQCFRRAVEIDPKSAIDYANIGVNLREKGEIEKAILMFKKALSLDPTIGFARKHLDALT